MFGLQLQLLIRDYFKERIFIVALVLILFVMGNIFGVLSAGVLEPGQKADLLNYVEQGLHGKVILENSIYVRQVITSYLQTIFFLFFMGISVIGVPLALLLIFTRGFVLGFSIGFLFENLGTKGAVLSLVGILPHNLLALPGLFLMVVAIIDCAAALTRMRFSSRRVQVTEELVQCAFLTMIVLVIMVLAGLVQGYV
ncbi:MAG TPA: stage II sporulation protein M, partial [Bacillota bacterium]